MTIYKVDFMSFKTHQDFMQFLAELGDSLTGFQFTAADFTREKLDHFLKIGALVAKSLEDYSVNPLEPIHEDQQHIDGDELAKSSKLKMKKGKKNV